MYELGRWLRETCRNGVGGSPTVDDFVIRRDADDFEQRAVRRRAYRSVLPIALSPGQYRRAIVSLTIATRGVSGRSASVNARPSTIGTPIVLK